MAMGIPVRKYGLFDNIEAMRVAPGDDASALLDKLLPRLAKGRRFLSSQLSAGPLLTILDGVKQLKCRTIMIEREYVDEDYLDEYSAYYCRTFAEHPQKCIRLHFFACEIEKRHLVALSSVRSDAYLGFSVIRPAGGFLTGRTVLRSWHEDGRSEFLVCKAEFEVNLAGNVLRVKGMPFFQQDTNVDICAEAALWMTSLYMWKKYGFRRVRPSQITEAATRYLTIGQVKRGLFDWQLLYAMREMGFEPLCFPNPQPSTPEEMARRIYAYMESEIPVLLLLADLPPLNEGHVVTAIGHNFNVSAMPPSCSGWNSDRIGYFYIHDDAAGPYRRLFVRAQPNQYSIEAHVRYALVPAPPEVMMDAPTALTHVEKLLAFAPKLPGYCTDDPAAQINACELQSLMKRTYLRKSNDFKTALSCRHGAGDADSTEMSPLFAATYRSMRMPKFVWVTELTTADLLCPSKGTDRRIMGEMLIDSTADHRAFCDSFLALHFGGRMIVRRPNAGNRPPLQALVDPAEAPYRHLVREP